MSTTYKQKGTAQKNAMTRIKRRAISDEKSIVEKKKVECLFFP